jgi:hypothetical protein
VIGVSLASYEILVFIIASPISVFTFTHQYIVKLKEHAREQTISNLKTDDKFTEFLNHTIDIVTFSLLVESSSELKKTINGTSHFLFIVRIWFPNDKTMNGQKNRLLSTKDITIQKTNARVVSDLVNHLKETDKSCEDKVDN